MCFPAWRSSEKLEVPFSHSRRVNRRRTAAPPGRDLVAMGSWPGATRAQQGEARRGTSHQASPGAPVPRGAGASPTFPALGIGTMRYHSRLARNPPNAAPGRALGLTRSLGVSGASPRPAPGPSGSESGSLPCSELGAPAAAARAPRRAGSPRTLRGEGAGGGGRVGPRGGRGRWGARPRGPSRREGRREDGAGDAANFSANCRAPPAPRPGTPARGHRQEMLRAGAPRGCRRDSGGGRLIPSGGAPGRPRATGGVGGRPGPGPGDVTLSARPALGGRRRWGSRRGSGEPLRGASRGAAGRRRAGGSAEKHQ